MSSVSLNRLVPMATGLVLLGLTFASAANANMAVRIDISTQTMTINIDGDHYATWRVSTARSGYYTPRGRFKPYLLKKMHYSRKYDNSPMPHSVFFNGGYAVHATNAIKRLGTPASHGCVRLHPSDAADFFQLVQVFGRSNTSIVITE